MNVLDQICATKRGEVARRKVIASPGELERRASQLGKPRPFAASLEKASKNGFGLIAEIKKASPSKGLIRHDFDPAAHAAAYERGGATCLSVLTDETYFQGSDTYLSQARDASTLPILRKDFMVDPWQVAESRALGADAILIIVAALCNEAMLDIEAAAISYSLDVLVEVHDRAEMERALRLQTRLLGVNNRDLRTFSTDLCISETLSAEAPRDVILVSESGITEHRDLLRLSGHGIRNFLVGESLMRQPDIEAATRTLLHG